MGGHGKAICSLGPGKRYNYRWIYEREEKEKEMKGKGRTTRKKSEGYLKKILNDFRRRPNALLLCHHFRHAFQRKTIISSF